ncbi:MAG TPA: hypothetical protein VIY27_10485, partial [Myxococcota bacterium]
LGDRELLENLRDEGLFPDDEISSNEAEELRVAVVLMREMGVNAAGVEVILHLRSRLLTLQTRTEEALRLLLRER